LPAVLRASMRAGAIDALWLSGPSYLIK